jgi:hypothetical protein
MQTKQHPELGYRACFGILRLSKVFGNDRLDAACHRALAINACSLKSIKSILDANLDKRQPLEQPRQLTIIEHDNIRGSAALNTTNNEGEHNANSSNTR